MAKLKVKNTTNILVRWKPKRFDDTILTGEVLSEEKGGIYIIKDLGGRIISKKKRECEKIGTVFHNNLRKQAEAWQREKQPSNWHSRAVKIEL